MSKLPPSDTPVEDYRSAFRRLNRIKTQSTIDATVPYHIHNHPTVTPPATSSALSKRVKFTLNTGSDLEDSGSDTDFVTPTKPRQKPPSSKPPSDKRKSRVLDLKVRSMMCEIKELTYQVEEGRTEMRLYKDKINDMQSIAHVALIQGEEIREYTEERMLRGDLKTNPHHAPTKKMRMDIPEVATIMRTVVKIRDDLNKVIRKYTEK